MLLENKLYGIVDFETCQKKDISVQDFSKAFFNGGGQNLQYRHKLSHKTSHEEQMSTIEKNIVQLISISDKYKNTNIILNDYADIANKYRLTIHLGQNDKNTYKLPFGRSTHNIQEVKSAIAEKANYIGFGAMFSSQTKPHIESNLKILKDILNLYKQDIVLIGGITLNNIHQLPQNNNIYYAIISDFFRYGNSPQSIEKYTRNFRF